MDKLFDSEKTLEIIESLKDANIGEYKKWKELIKKIKKGVFLLTSIGS